MSGDSVSLPMAMAIAGFFAIAIYNTIELLVWIFSMFKHRSGLYFWSMLVATIGIPVHAIAVLLRYFSIAPNLPMCVILIIGRWAMVTGQSVVLYSRLHLVVCDVRKIKWILVMIITSFCILQMPVSVLFFGSNSGHPEPFISAFDIYGKVQLAGFTVQEGIISGLYIYEAAHSLRPIMAVKGAEGQNIIRHLVVLFIIVVILDSSLMATEFANNFPVQTTYKPFVYSIKLKIEFITLNKLLAFTRIRACNCHRLDSTPTAGFSHCCTNATVSIKDTGMVSRDAGQDGRDMEIRGMGETMTDHIYNGDPSTIFSILPRVGSGIVASASGSSPPAG
ncbi:hypothetical protein EDB80DRAFT_182800 [Ilyonectria destructans]|nr:hypothetical protein EDB80DRAFT_182800 [Ilyonectria destructans]